jgi:hypothetical protein
MLAEGMKTQGEYIWTNHIVTAGRI